MEVEHRPPGPGRPALEIHRSPRRRRSAQAYARDGSVVVRLPAGLEAVEEEQLIDRLVRRITGAAAAEAFGGDTALEARAAELADRYLDGVRPAAVSWSARMTRRHGSCTPVDGTIRISREVAGYPAFVRDYVLVHELAHLVVADHSAAFEALVQRYPATDRARGWLEGYPAGRLAAATPDGQDGPSRPAPPPSVSSPSAPPSPPAPSSPSAPSSSEGAGRSPGGS